MAIHGFSELTCTPLYPKYLAFRHQVFNAILRYHESGNPVFSFTAYDSNQRPLAHGPNRRYDVEYDNYDIPKAMHLAYVRTTPRRRQVKSYEILGCLRLLPTDGPYMIKDSIRENTWKGVELCIKELPSRSSIYEASRIAVSPELADNPEMRNVVLDSLVYANIEIAARVGITKMIGIMYDRVWQSVYRERNVPITYISNPFHVDDGPPVIIGEIDTSLDTLEQVSYRLRDALRRGDVSKPLVDSGTLLAHYYHVNRNVNDMHEKAVAHREFAYAEA